MGLVSSLPISLEDHFFSLALEPISLFLFVLDDYRGKYWGNCYFSFELHGEIMKVFFQQLETLEGVFASPHLLNIWMIIDGNAEENGFVHVGVP